MKKIYFLFAILFSGTIFAQIVNIPDATFKAYLLSASSSNDIAFDANGNNVAIDTNGNNEIEITEAALIKELKINSSQSQNIDTSLINNIIGTKSFVNLTKLSVLYLTNYNFNTVDVSGMTSLEDLFITSPYVNNLNVDNCTNLLKLQIQACDFQTLTLNVPSLKTLHLEEELNNLNFQGCPNIEFLYLEDLQFTTLSLQYLVELKELTIRNYGKNWLNFTANISNNVNLQKIEINILDIKNLSIANNPLLTEISSFNSNNIPTVYINNNPLLKNFSLSESEIINLTLLGSPLLETFDVEDNHLTSLDLTQYPLLKTLKCGINQLTSLDLSSNPQINFLDCIGNNLQILNLKNGGQSFAFSLFVGNNSTLKYVCCNTDAINDIIFFLVTVGGNTNVNINSYCTFTPGGTFYTIQGETKYDSNNNGCDPADPKKALQKYTISGANGTGNLIGNTTGQFFLPVQSGSNTITPVLENPTYFNISPASFTANFPTMTSPLTQNFCLTANGNHDDLEIVIIPVNAARPGFVSEYKVLFKNKGTATQAGNFNFNYDDYLMNFLSTSLATSSQSFGVLNYNFTNLLPFQTRELTVKFTLNTPTQTPPLVGGQVLNYTAQINGATDETPLDNTFTLNQTVVNSFDPNDKTCLEGATIAQTKVGDYVHYLIRFENTGTANAENIVVKDIIDTAKYDINSLVAMNGSHSFVTRITNPNTVEFIFENIQLPFNDLYNDGYVSFKIKTKSTLVLGDSFSNTANIYFDYNAPIVTNTATTTVAQILGTQESLKENSLSFYPNPVEDVIHFKTDEKLLKLEIYDVSGRIVGSVQIQNNKANLSFLKTGNYLIKLFTKDRYYLNKIVKK